MNKLLLVFLSGLCALHTYAQGNKYDATKELRGNGQLIRETKSVESFEEITINQFPAKVAVEVGGTTSAVTLSVDDNLRPLLHIESKNGTLTLSFKDPNDKPFWISKANVAVAVKTPVLKRLSNGSNGDVTVSGITGNSFDLTNQANGNVTLRGTVNRLNVVSLANGRVNAEQLMVDQASVVTQANATVSVNAKQLSSQKMAFATIRNVAEQSESSSKTQVSEARSDQKLVSIRFKNNSALPRTFTLISYAPGEEGNETNGFTLAPYANRQKQYPVGTTVYVATKDQVGVVMSGKRLSGKPFLTVDPGDDGRTVDLVK
ncbi:GIN domain-containing protein [Spirosoma soli]|uniref:GIN domain-containing protein n=1 Tax=Spirosoma soli TaxID=1770529 RepID=A0ABW5M5V1_9BACT